MTRDIHSWLRTIGREHPHIFVEVLIALSKRDESSIGREHDFGLIVPSRMNHFHLTARKIKPCEVCEIAHEEQARSVGRSNGATIIVRSTRERLHINLQRISPARGIEFWILLLLIFLVVLLRIFLLVLSCVRSWCVCFLLFRHCFYGSDWSCGSRGNCWNHRRNRLRLTRSARFGASLRHRRCIQRIATITITRKVQRHAVRAPTEIAFARFAFTHAARRRLVFSRAYEHITIRNHRHRLAIRRERGLTDPAADLLKLAVCKAVVGGRNSDLLRLRALLAQVKSIEIAKHRKHRKVSISTHGESMNVFVRKLSEPRA